MKKILVTAGCIVVSVMSASKAAAANLNFSQFFVFGDSLSDTGNVFTATSALGNPIPVPTTTSGQPAYFNGRFSNGPIWVDYFGQQIGKQLTPFFQSQFLGTQGGVNYAFSGAETGVQSINVPVPGILGQVGLFTGQANVPVDSNAIYSIFGGANDYTSAFTRGVAPNVNQTVENLTNSINSLAQKNAKNFLVFNLPDIGDTPLARANNLTQPLNALVQQHNSQLATALNGLRTQRPDLNIYSVDFNSLFKTIRSNPGQFGFTNVNDACVTGNNTLATNVCSNPNEYLFFDDVHPSSAAHKLLANAALASIENGNKSIPEPSVVLGLLALAGLGAKRVVKRKSKKLVLK